MLPGLRTDVAVELSLVEVLDNLLDGRGGPVPVIKIPIVSKELELRGPRC